MAADLLDQLEAFEAERRALLERVEACAPDQLDHRPRPDAWTLLEVVEHLVIAEREVLQDLPEQAGLVPRGRGIRHRLKYFLVLFILWRGVTVPVPSPTMAPAGGRSLSELRARWDENHVWLRTYLGDLDAAQARGAVFTHPVTGPIAPAQTLRLMRVHLRSHLRDVAELLVPASAAQG